VILIGQYDSPFVRRVAAALHAYELAYEHRPWSVWSDADTIAVYNPLRRVPTVVLDDGTVLIDSAAILDALDELAGPTRALVPRAGTVRREVLRVSALACGAADKAVSLFHERRLHAVPSSVWLERCATQIADTFDRLERQRAAQASPYWTGAAWSHADIALTCALRFTRETHAGPPHLPGRPAPVGAGRALRGPARAPRRGPAADRPCPGRVDSPGHDAHAHLGPRQQPAPRRRRHVRQRAAADVGAVDRAR